MSRSFQCSASRQLVDFPPCLSPQRACLTNLLCCILSPGRKTNELETNVRCLLVIH